MTDDHKAEAERLLEAIDMLENLSSHTDTDNWFSNRYYVGAGVDRFDPDEEVARAGSVEVGELIAALGRSVGAIIYMLRCDVEMIEASSGEQLEKVLSAVRRAGDLAIADAIIEGRS